MKVTAVARAKKVPSSVGFVFLLFFLGGCANSAGQVGVMTKCRQAEVTVNAAQKQYDEATQNFAKNPKDERLRSILASKVQSLLETEENAYQMCNRVR